MAGTAITYDTNGNLKGDDVWTYTYDADNKLKTAAKTGYAASLAYDPEARLRRTTLAGVVTDLVYDGTDLVAEYDGSGNVLRRYVHGPGVDEPLVWYEGSGTTTKTWLYADHLGSVVASANGAGTSTAIHTYGPYGEPNVTTGVRFRYTGQQLLGDLNLYYYKARFYSPALGRFLQTDPTGTADDLNLYAYVGNNPANRIDPSGLVDLNLFSAAHDAATHAAAEKVVSPPNTFTVGGHGNPGTLVNANGKDITPAALAQTVYNHPAYNSSMNVRLIACNVGVSPRPGIPSYAEQFQNELTKLGGKGATEGANNFAWYPSDETPLWRLTRVD